MKSFRVIVMLNEATPELMAEIENMPPRLRAERMRVLATLGLQIARAPRASFVQAGVGDQTTGQSAANGSDPVAAAAIGAIQESESKIRPPSKRLSSLARSLGSS